MMDRPAATKNEQHPARAEETFLIRGTNWVGDAVMSLPAVRELRRHHPGARLRLIIRPELAGLYRWVPEVDEVVEYRRRPGLAGMRDMLRFARMVRDRRSTVYLCLQNAFEAALLGRLAGVPSRVGYALDGRSALLTRPVPVPAAIQRRHQVYYYLQLLFLAGLSGVDYLQEPGFAPDMSIRRTPAMEEIAGRWSDELGFDRRAPLIGIHAGAFYGSAKRWPPERFAELIQALRPAVAAQFLLFGSAGEKPLADEIMARAGGAGVTSLCGRTSLAELVALCGSCRLFISNDSGPMHLAAALRVPQLALFGSTDPVATGPFSPRAIYLKKPVECSPCFLRQCPIDLRCFQALTVAEVFQKAADLFHSV